MLNAMERMKVVGRSTNIAIQSQRLEAAIAVLSKALVDLKSNKNYMTNPLSARYLNSIHLLMVSHTKASKFLNLNIQVCPCPACQFLI
jgi:hypothetical protein